MDKPNLIYCIGGVNVGIISHCNQQLYRDQVLAAFETDGKPDVQIYIASEEAPSIKGAEMLHDVGGWLYAYRHNDDLMIGFRIPDPNDPFPYQMISLKEDRFLATIYLRLEGVQTAGFLHPLQRPAAEILMLHFLSQKDGAMFHSCGVDDHGHGYLFIGSSGAGKSTLGRIWESAGTPILNDENVIVRRFESGFHMYGTPWTGDDGMYHPSSCQLETIFFIEHASENFVTPVEGIKAAIPMVLQTFPQLWHERRTKSTLALLAELASHVPCYRLGFAPDSRVIEFVRNIS